MSNATFASITISGFASSIKEIEVNGKRLLKFGVVVYSYFKGEEQANSFDVELWNGAGDDLLRRLDGQSLKSALVVLTGGLILKSYEGKLSPTIVNPQILSLTLKKSESEVESEPEFGLQTQDDSSVQPQSEITVEVESPEVQTQCDSAIEEPQPKAKRSRKSAKSE